MATYDNGHPTPNTSIGAEIDDAILAPITERPRQPQPRLAAAPGGIPILRREVIGVEEEFDKFACDTPQIGPPTPDALTPDVVVIREMFVNLDLTMPDGVKVRFWGFKSPDGEAQFPNEAIRVPQGKIIHTHLEVRKNAHTIHHHGIEPSTFNDGVPHTSFEAKPEYTYQWFSSQAGTYWYHCHVNATLHIEMGMYGQLIIDPPEGPGFLFQEGPTYDVEKLWSVDEVDPRWHELNHHAGIACPFGPDVGLHLFRPKYFFIHGVPSPLTEEHPRAVVEAAAGQNILIRAHNAGYTIHRYTFPVDLTVEGIDGRPLGRRRGGPTAEAGRYSHPIPVAAGRSFELTSAERHDLLIRNAPAGNHMVTIDFMDWQTRQVYHTARTFIRVGQ